MLAVGCAHIGPRTVAVDRFDYSTAIADSWKQQTLLNIVKLRYMDLPVFVDVASIVAGYSLQTGVTVDGVVSSSGAVQGNYGSLGGQAIYTDRPTITYVPMTGEKFLRGLITPIDPKNIFFMLQSGYAADFILGLTVESLNGVRNRSTAGGVVREADPEFVRALDLLREVQAAGAVGMRVEEDKAKDATGVVFFRRDDVLPKSSEKTAEIRRLLKMPADQQKFVLAYSPGTRRGRRTDREQPLDAPDHGGLRELHGRTRGAPEGPQRDALVRERFKRQPSQNVRIHSGKDKPAAAFAAVHYRDHWFWVDDGDWQTKRAITAVMFFFTLADTGDNDKLPLITIPAQ